MRRIEEENREKTNGRQQTGGFTAGDKLRGRCAAAVQQQHRCFPPRRQPCCTWQWPSAGQRVDPLRQLARTNRQAQLTVSRSAHGSGWWWRRRSAKLTATTVQPNHSTGPAGPSLDANRGARWQDRAELQEGPVLSHDANCPSSPLGGSAQPSGVWCVAAAGTPAAHRPPPRRAAAAHGAALLQHPLQSSREHITLVHVH